jgi:hypothetical protein
MANQSNFGQLVPGMDLPGVAKSTHLGEITAGNTTMTSRVELDINAPWA